MRYPLWVESWETFKKEMSGRTAASLKRASEFAAYKKEISDQASSSVRIESTVQAFFSNKTCQEHAIGGIIEGEYQANNCRKGEGVVGDVDDSHCGMQDADEFD